MKVSITHCYTDKNKGDSAIIISTVQLIREVAGTVTISAFSTYGEKDIRFKTEHDVIRNYVDNMFPGLFPDPVPCLGLKSDKARIPSFIWILIKSSVSLLTRNKLINKLFLSKHEYTAFYEFLSSDIIVSKGGSYLTSQNGGLRQTFSLARMLYPFLLARRYKKKIAIYSQSLGPVEGRFNKWIFKKSLSGVSFTYLREKNCYENYPSVRSVLKEGRYQFIPDTAFFLDGSSKNDKIKFNLDKLNVGITLVDHAFKGLCNKEEVLVKRKNYKSSMIASIKYLVDHLGAEVHLFPQVTVDNSCEGYNDVKISREIVGTFKNTAYQSSVFFHEGDWNPFDLKYFYSCMDLFIGTRLHSVIFAMSSYIPSLNISYHGTKSSGILKSIYGDSTFALSIDDITPESLIEKIEFIYTHKDRLAGKLRQTVPVMRTELTNAMRHLVNLV